MLISKLLSNKEDHDKVDVRVGLSSIFSDFIYFSNKYQEASSTLSVSRFTNSGNVISYDDIESEETFQVILTTENIKELDYVILFEDEKTINDTFERYIKRAKTDSNQSVDLQLYIIAAANIILRYSLSLGVDLKQYFKGGLLNRLIKLPAGTEIHLTGTFDNRASNPFNPIIPPVDVKWGGNSFDEMLILGMEYLDYLPEDENILLDEH